MLSRCTHTENISNFFTHIYVGFEIEIFRESQKLFSNRLEIPTTGSSRTQDEIEMSLQSHEALLKTYNVSATNLADAS